MSRIERLLLIESNPTQRDDAGRRVRYLIENK